MSNNINNSKFDKITQLIEIGEYHKALELLVLLKKELNHFLIHWYLGHVYFKLHKYLEAINQIKKSIDLKSEDSLNLNFLGEIYLEINEPNQAIKFFNQAYKLNNQNNSIILNLIKANLNINNVQMSEKYLNLLTKRNPSIYSYHYGLINISKRYLTDKLVDEIKKNINDQNNDNKIYSNLILAKKSEIDKDYTLEMKYLQNAHELYNKSKSNLLEQQFNYYNDFLPKFIKNSKNLKINPNTKLNPIFIMGLPRSGTTLVERIIVSGKNKVQSLGETDVFDKVFFSNQIINTLDNDILADLHQKIIDQYSNQGYSESNLKFTDKSIANFLYIDLISKIFPNAKFVYCLRNPVANLIGLSRSFLPNVYWSHSIKKTCEMFNNYFKKLDEIKKDKSIKIHVIELEHLTNDPENVSKKLFKFLDLDWSIDCVQDYSNDLIVKTASNLQVRKEIKKHDLSYTSNYLKIFKDMGLNYDWLS